MYHATLKKIESNHNNLRTDMVSGLVPALPVVGAQFFMYSNEALTPGAVGRYIYTSQIQEVRLDLMTGETIFRTENSLYSLTGVRFAQPVSSANSITDVDSTHIASNHDHSDDGA